MTETRAGLLELVTIVAQADSGTIEATLTEGDDETRIHVSGPATIIVRKRDAPAKPQEKVSAFLLQTYQASIIMEPHPGEEGGAVLLELRSGSTAELDERLIGALIRGLESMRDAIKP